MCPTPIGGSPISPAYGYSYEPVFAPRPVRPKETAPPKPKPAPQREQSVARVSFPGPDELGIRLGETVDLPPPQRLGIGVE